LAFEQGKAPFMPRFFIHFRTADGTIANDQEGIDLPNLEDASEAAKHSIRELIGNDLKSDRLNPVEAAIIADENGRELVTIPTNDALLGLTQS
jgi:hypothetical protein